MPADGRPVVARVRVRRMRWPTLGYPVQTFREQVPGVLDRYQPRTTRLVWYAHITLSMLALAWLSATRTQAAKGEPTLAARA